MPMLTDAHISSLGYLWLFKSARKAIWYSVNIAWDVALCDEPVALCDEHVTLCDERISLYVQF